MVFGICPIVQEKRMNTNEDVKKRKINEPIFRKNKYSPRTLIILSKTDAKGLLKFLRYGLTY